MLKHIMINLKPVSLFFVTLSSLVLSVNCIAQSNPVFGNAGTNEFVYGICSDNSGDSYIGGLAGNSALLTKLDISNNIIWSKNLQFSSNGGHKSVITSVDIVGDTIFGCGWIEFGSSIRANSHF